MADIFVTIPAEVAVLIDRVFLPSNPNKLRTPSVFKDGKYDPTDRDRLKAACWAFKEAVKAAEVAAFKVAAR